MRILLLSPYHGGSHQAWAEGYKGNSRHDVELLTLPARFWKWRMHGAAITLARHWLASAAPPSDLILSTDLLDLTTFLALTCAQTSRLPVALYMHENQLTYPLPDDPTIGPMRRQLGERDRHYAFINYASMLAADRVFFNSHYHLANFFGALTPFLRHYPEYNELDTVDVLRHKSSVLPVGVDFHRLETATPDLAPIGVEPLILWNQRLEFDKNPEEFISLLAELAGEGIPFRVALCGERFGKPTLQWESAVSALGERVIHNGYADPERYRHLLWEADITISTASHEYFGISILEAIYCRTFPLLPARLSYPELIPSRFHADCLYRGRADLVKRLRWALSDLPAIRAVAAALAPEVAAYDWRLLGPHYDERFEALVP